jgi:MYXO-CTERM domain-containing protein
MAGATFEVSMTVKAIWSGLGLLALCVMSSNSAFAIEIGMEARPVVGETIYAGDQLEVDVILNTEEFVGITLLSVGVLHDAAQLSYNRGQSRTTDWLLYNEGARPGAYLYPAITCDDEEGLGCSLWVGGGAQVNVDFISTNLLVGTASATGTTEYSEDEVLPGGVLATLVFDVAPGAVTGSTSVTLSITSPGNVIGTPGGGFGTATLVGDGSFEVYIDDTPPADTGPDASPSDAGPDVAPSDAGTDPSPSDAGLDVAPSDAGLDVAPSDTGTDPPPEDVIDTSPDTSPPTDTGGDAIVVPDVGADTPPAPDTVDANRDQGSPHDVVSEGDPAPTEEATEGSGGCSCSMSSSPAGGAFMWLFSCAALLATRRRRP